MRKGQKHTTKTRRKMQRSHWRRLHPECPIKPSSLETILYAALDELGVSYVKQHRIGNWRLDAYVPASKFDLESDGSYWHSDPEAVRKDAWRDEDLRRRGIRVVRLSDIDLECDPIGAIIRGVLAHTSFSEDPEEGDI